jgi:predicted RNase H-like HicB family nuclease
LECGSEAAALQTNKMKYVAIVEEGANSFGAYVPDLPGCAVVGETREEALRLIREAVELHVSSMRERGDALPEPASSTEYVQVSSRRGAMGALGGRDPAPTGAADAGAKELAVAASPAGETDGALPSAPKEAPQH